MSGTNVEHTQGPPGRPSRSKHCQKNLTAMLTLPLVLLGSPKVLTSTPCSHFIRHTAIIDDGGLSCSMPILKVMFKLDASHSSFNRPACVSCTFIEKVGIHFKQRTGANHGRIFLTLIACFGFSAPCSFCCPGLLGLYVLSQQLHKNLKDMSPKEFEEKPYMMQHVRSLMFFVYELAGFGLHRHDVGLVFFEVNPKIEIPNICGAYAALAQRKCNPLKYGNAVAASGFFKGRAWPRSLFKTVLYFSAAVRLHCWSLRL